MVFFFLSKPHSPLSRRSDERETYFRAALLSLFTYVWLRMSPAFLHRFAPLIPTALL